MVHKDLRDFLACLEREGQLLRIKEEILPEPDIGAAACAANKGLGETAPALVFESIKGYRNAKIVTNIHGSWPNMSLAFGMDKDTPVKDLILEFVRRYENFDNGKYEIKDSAPWQEVVIDKGINLYNIMPLFRLNPGDGGFYINKASIVSRHPDRWDSFDEQNLGMYRLQVKGTNRIGIQTVPEHDIALHLQAAEQKNKPLPIAICLGNDPMASIVSSMPILYDQSEFQMAGALNEEPYPIVKLENGLCVPWGSEYILEGYILPRVREAEGPYGEFTGHFSGCKKMPVVKITKVSHRKDPIYEFCNIGVPWNEIDYLFVNTCPPLHVQIRKRFPEVVAVNALYTHGLGVIVSTKVRVGGRAKSIGLSVLQTPHGTGYAKVVILVDETVDPFNLPQVMWALTVKYNPQFDTVIVPNLSVVNLDPASDPPGVTHKIIIDATTPSPPEVHGHFTQQVKDPPTSEDWILRLKNCLKINKQNLLMRKGVS